MRRGDGGNFRGRAFVGEVVGDTLSEEGTFDLPSKVLFGHSGRERLQVGRPQPRTPSCTMLLQNRAPRFDSLHLPRFLHLWGKGVAELEGPERPCN